MSARFEILGRPGQYHFVLKAENDEVVATSETYTTKQSCEHGIQVVKRIAPGAPVIDLSQSAGRISYPRR
jgi:uncharacterized protein YegP (UPF0339 family)